MESEPIPSKRIRDLAQISVTRRIELAKTFLSGPSVQCYLNIDAATLIAWRNNRRLLAVWHEPAVDWRYPDFQFDGTNLIQQMPQLLAAFEPYHSHVWTNTWSIVEWFVSPHVMLDGICPAEAMTTNPQRVLEIAELEFLQDPSTQW